MNYPKMRYLASALAALAVALAATAVWAQPPPPDSCFSVMCPVGTYCDNGECVEDSGPAAAVPEPTSALLFAAGIAVAAISTARMRRK